MEEQNPSSSSRLERKIIEKNRRTHMKTLCSQLNSLVHHQNSCKEATTLPDQLEEAENYIKKLEKRLEKMRKRKDNLLREKSDSYSTANPSSSSSAVLLKSPQIEVRQTGSALEVILITGLDCQSMFYHTIRVLHEAGAEVVNAGFSVVDDSIYHTIHSKIEESKMECVATSIAERLKKFSTHVK